MLWIELLLPLSHCLDWWAEAQALHIYLTASPRCRIVLSLGPWAAHGVKRRTGAFWVVVGGGGWCDSPRGHLGSDRRDLGRTGWIWRSLPGSSRAGPIGGSSLLPAARGQRFSRPKRFPPPPRPLTGNRGPASLSFFWGQTAAIREVFFWGGGVYFDLQVSSGKASGAVSSRTYPKISRKRTPKASKHSCVTCAKYPVENLSKRLLSSHRSL